MRAIYKYTPSLMNPKLVVAPRVDQRSPIQAREVIYLPVQEVARTIMVITFV